MAKRTPPWPAWPKWTEAKWWAYLRSGLRRMYSRWPARFEALKNAKRPCEGKGRQKFEYQCNKCKEWFPQKEVEVNHIIPCGSLKSWEELVPFTQKLFCHVDGFEVVCKPCHKEITRLQKDEK